MKPQVIEFNGLGRPNPPGIAKGHVAILVRRQTSEVVRIELLPPEDFGPVLHAARNQGELRKEVEAWPETLDPRELTANRD